VSCRRSSYEKFARKRIPYRAPEGRNILAQGASSPGWSALTPSRVCGTPLSRAGGRGEGERGYRQPTAYAVG
jgi:hypothetical protein